MIDVNKNKHFNSKNYLYFKVTFYIIDHFFIKLLMKMSLLSLIKKNSKNVYIGSTILPNFSLYFFTIEILNINH